jgi:hypothetical protein
MSGNITSTGKETIKAKGGITIQAVFAGSSPNGTFKLQISNDLANNVADVTNWIDLADSSYAITADGSYAWFISGIIKVKFVRLVYTRTSGSGTLNATISFTEEL